MNELITYEGLRIFLTGAETAVEGNSVYFVGFILHSGLVTEWHGYPTPKGYIVDIPGRKVRHTEEHILWRAVLETWKN